MIPIQSLSAVFLLAVVLVACGGGSVVTGQTPSAEKPRSSSFSVAPTAHHLDVFWTGRNGSIESTWWDSGPKADWSDHSPFSPAPAGSAPAGAPITVVSRAPDQLDIFWVHADGSVWSNWWSLPKSGWGDHPFAVAPAGSAQPGTQVVAVARTATHLDLFWITPTDAIGSTWWDAGPKSSWGDHTPFTVTPANAVQGGSSVAAVARTPKHLDVFWVMPNGAIGSTWWDAAPKSGWDEHQPFAITRAGVARAQSPIAALGRLPDHLDVFWIGPAGIIATTWWDAAPNGEWRVHRPFPITAARAAGEGSGLTAVSRNENHIDVFWVGANGAIGSTWWDAASGASWEDHAPFVVTKPGAARTASVVSAVARTPAHLDVFWIGPDSAIDSTWWDSAPDSGWEDHSPFAIAKARSAWSPFALRLELRKDPAAPKGRMSYTETPIVSPY